MKKSLLKATTIMMAVAMLSGALTGCGNSGSGNTTSTASTGTDASASGTAETPVISYYYPTAPSEHDKKVWDSLNPYLKEKANVTVDYHPSDWGEYDDRTSTIVSSGQDFDVMFCNNTYFSKVQLGACLPVEEYLQKEAVWKELPEWLWKAATVDGHIYGVPTYKDCAAVPGMIWNKTMADELGITVPASYKKEKDMNDLFYEAKKKRDAAHPEDANIPLLISTQMTQMFDGTATNFAATNIPGMELCAGYKAGEQVFNYYDTPEYAEMAKLHKQWVTDGIYPMDSANYDTEAGVRNSGKIMFQFTLGYVSVDPHMWGQDFEISFSPCDERFLATGYVMFGSNVVGAKSKNPEAAVRYLNMVNTDNFVANTIRFGVEGEYWKKTDDNRLDFTDTLNADPQQRAYYNWYGWQFGQLFCMSLPQQESATLWDDLKKANETAYVSDNMGWVFDQTPVSTEIASCNAIVTEYNDNLERGMSPDVDKAVADFRQKLKDAGVDKITAEAQKQLNEWRAANNKSVAK